MLGQRRKKTKNETEGREVVDEKRVEVEVEEEDEDEVALQL